jgi:major membrane immunogen (membrane-anchored lipoprotein)
MKKIILIMIFALLLVACSGDDIVGTWVDEATGMEIVFDDDGNCSFQSVSIKYETEDGLLIMIFDDEEQEMAYEIEGEELTLSFPDLDDFEVTYHRKE